jgi:AhpD family alkylhydroperoxidase
MREQCRVRKVKLCRAVCDESRLLGSEAEWGVFVACTSAPHFVFVDELQKEWVMSEQNYPRSRRHLNVLMRELAEELPGPFSGFAQLRHQAVAAGVLSKKVKELIALGIVISARCDDCIAWHVHDALRAGATRQEIIETIGVALLMGGGPAAIYGCEALEALGQYETELAEEQAA